MLKTRWQERRKKWHRRAARQPKSRADRPKWSQGAAQRKPKWSENWGKCLQDVPESPRGGHNDETWVFRKNSGIPFGIAKSTKNRYLAEKWVPRAVLLSSFFALAAFVAFWVKFSFIFHEKSMKIEPICVASHCLFLNLATLMIHRILRCKMYFWIFRFLNFSTKIHQNLCPKWNPGKSSETVPPWAPKLT